MPLHPALRDRKAVVFDAYGTLFDVHAAVQRHAAQIGRDAARLSELWRAKQLEYSWILSLAGRYEPFWSLTERALDHALARFPQIDPEVRANLLAAYRALDAYPEVPDVLAALKRSGLRTGILSNGDPAMLDAAVTSAGLAPLLDAVLSVEAAGIFKTAPPAYQLALEAFRLPREDILFLSSNRWDIAGATAFGLPSAWVNRIGAPEEYPGLAPLAVIGSLSALVSRG
jgi:2-haloacid dehalogenase